MRLIKRFFLDLDSECLPEDSKLKFFSKYTFPFVHQEHLIFILAHIITKEAKIYQQIRVKSWKMVNVLNCMPNKHRRFTISSGMLQRLIRIFLISCEHICLILNKSCLGKGTLVQGLSKHQEVSSTTVTKVTKLTVVFGVLLGAIKR